MRTLKNHLSLVSLKWILAAVLPIALAGLALTLATSVKATSSCSGTGCNGLNPLMAGCTGSQTILASQQITDWNGVILGTLNLVHSSDCNTVYAELTASWENSDLYVDVTSDGLSYYTSTVGSAAYSPMIYDPNPSGAESVGSVGIYTTTVFDCQPIPGTCPPSYHYGSANIFAP